MMIKCNAINQENIAFASGNNSLSNFPTIAFLQLKFYPHDEKVRTINQETNMILQKQK